MVYETAVAETGAGVDVVGRWLALALKRKARMAGAGVGVEMWGTGEMLGPGRHEHGLRVWVPLGCRCGCGSQSRHPHLNPHLYPTYVLPIHGYH